MKKNTGKGRYETMDHSTMTALPRFHSVCEIQAFLISPRRALIESEQKDRR
jgi:hypothetical protein